MTTGSTVAARWFEARRGMAIGISAGGMSAGQLVMIPLASVLTIWFGWRTSYLWLGIALLFTLPLGLATLLTPYGNNYDVLIAGSVMTIIPIVILFFFFQRYFISGLTVGGVKG